jgi:uncharacterized protein
MAAVRRPTDPPDNTETELDALEDCCRRLAGFRAGVSVEWADGFLTALAAGPRRIDTPQALSAMFGDDFARCFADPDDHAQAVDAIEARLAVLRRQLDAEVLLDEPDQLRLAPILLQPADAPGAAPGPAERDDGVEWASGFLDAVQAFPDDWPEPDRDTDDGRMALDALASITALTLEPDALAADLAERRPERTLSRDELVDEACWAAQDLRLYWIDHAPRPATIRLAPQPGRNDPCPCGSGRKFKKCCGAASA